MHEPQLSARYIRTVIYIYIFARNVTFEIYSTDRFFSSSVGKMSCLNQDLCPKRFHHLPLSGCVYYDTSTHTRHKPFCQSHMCVCVQAIMPETKSYPTLFNLEHYLIYCRFIMILATNQISWIDEETKSGSAGDIHGFIRIFTRIFSFYWLVKKKWYIIIFVF